MATAKQSLDEGSDLATAEVDPGPEQVGEEVTAFSEAIGMVTAEVSHDAQPRIRIVRRRRAATVEVDPHIIRAQMSEGIAGENIDLRIILCRRHTRKAHCQRTQQSKPFHSR